MKVNEVLESAAKKMAQISENTAQRLNRIQANVITPAALDRVSVAPYGEPASLKEVALFAKVSPITLSLKPFDPSHLKLIEQSIQKTLPQLDVRRQNDQVLLISLPKPTEEGRREKVKEAQQQAEQGKISLRNSRNQAKNELKKTIDQYSQEIDTRLATKTKNLLTIS